MNFKMKSNESGITLVALIITVIILVILAAITIKSIYQTDIVGLTVNGAINYSEQSVKEQDEMNQTVSFMQNAINGINGGDSGGDMDSGIDSGINFGSLSDSDKEALIGQYVAYTPISVEGGFTSEAQYSGYDSDQSFETNTDATWRILFIDSDKITLISTDVTNEEFYLQGANGYNNAVYLLNNACKTMYSNSSLSATARSLNRGDIEAITGYNGATNTEYTPSNKYYPSIFAQEKTGYVDSGYGSTYGLSEQSEYIEQTSTLQATTLKGMYTYYLATLSSYCSGTNLELLAYSPGTTTALSTNWLASRCVSLRSSSAYFGVCVVDSGGVGANYLYDSYNDVYSAGCSLRPAVEVTLSSVAIGATGSGTSSDPYSITAK